LTLSLSDHSNVDNGDEVGSLAGVVSDETNAMQQALRSKIESENDSYRAYAYLSKRF
jgi:hypothetical protein